MTLLNKSLISALSFLFLVSISPVTSAAENPFGMTDQSAQPLQLASNHSDDKCGKGKCGDSKKCGDGMKCGQGKCGDSKKCGDGKGKDEDDKGKCGKGKCASNLITLNKKSPDSSGLFLPG